MAQLKFIKFILTLKYYYIRTEVFRSSSKSDWGQEEEMVDIEMCLVCLMIGVCGKRR